MKPNNQQATKLRKSLIQRLNQDGSSFDFTAFVKEAGVDAQLARTVAELVFTRFFAQVIEDGEITERERRQLTSLAQRLVIAAHRHAEIEQKVASRAYRDRLSEAQADGVLTKRELDDLRELKSNLGLSRQSEPAGIDRAAKFATVKASREYAERNSPARHARLPKYHPAGKIVLWLVVFGILGVGAFASLLGALASFAGVVFIGVPFLIVGVLVIGVGCLCCWVWVKRLKQVETTPVAAEAAIVVDKRKIVNRETWSSEGLEGRISDDKTGIRVSVLWYATFEDEQGERREYELFALDNSESYNLGTDQLERAPEPRFPFYSGLTAGDAGVLYARDNVAFDFDKIC